ncbi:MAG: CvpA family protein [Gammaproteobacteria bacterium]|nr:CvpA family protein [Gammaproteobacteria bacterium]
MNWADVVILVLVGLSMLISLWRGFTREALSLVAWIAAFWVGFTFAWYPAALLEPHVGVPSARLALGFLGLFIVTLLLGGIVNYLIGKAVDKTGMTGTDRMLGLIFGLARGIVLVAILVLLAGLTPLPRDPWWQEAMLVGHFQLLAERLRDLLPADIAAYFVYDAT